jgi:hypothetical protein
MNIKHLLLLLFVLTACLDGSGLDIETRTRAHSQIEVDKISFHKTDYVTEKARREFESKTRQLKPGDTYEKIVSVLGKPFETEHTLWSACSLLIYNADHKETGIQYQVHLVNINSFGSAGIVDVRAAAKKLAKKIKDSPLKTVSGIVTEIIAESPSLTFFSFEDKNGKKNSVMYYKQLDEKIHGKLSLNVHCQLTYHSAFMELPGLYQFADPRYLKSITFTVTKP